MWTHEHVGETDAAPEAVWAVLADIDGWAAWDTSMQAISLLGPFEVGTEVAMTPAGQDPIRSRIAEIVPYERYADRTEFGGVVLQFSHTLTRLADGGTQVTHRLEITGPAADQIGPGLGSDITSDFPEAMDGLIGAAAGSTVDQ